MTKPRSVTVDVRSGESVITYEVFFDQDRPVLVNSLVEHRHGWNRRLLWSAEPNERAQTAIRAARERMAQER